MLAAAATAATSTHEGSVGVLINGVGVSPSDAWQDLAENIGTYLQVAVGDVVRAVHVALAPA